MLATAIKQKAAALTAAPKYQYQIQLYNQPVRLSSIFEPLQKKFQLKQIQQLLAEILFALQRPTVNKYDKTTLLLCFDRLLRLYISNRMELKR